jgi:hypothetical protein
MSSWTINASKTLVAGLLIGAVLAQTWFLPTLAIQTAGQYPEVDSLRIPFMLVGIAIVGCAEVILVCVWRLLSMVHHDRIFSVAAFKFVTAMIVALLVATVLLASVWVTLMFGVQLGGPGIVYPLFAGVVACATLALIVVVMLGLLKKASQQESYLAEVV